MKSQIKKLSFITSVIVISLAFSQPVLAASDNASDGNSMSALQVIGYFALLVFFIVAPAFKNSHRNAKN